MVLIPIPSTVMLNSNPVDVAGLPSLDEESGAVSTRALESEGAGQESHLGDSVEGVHGFSESKYELSIGKISNLHISHMF